MFELQRRAEVIPELGALGLVVNIIVLWNTMSRGCRPSFMRHINLLGRYSFAVPDAVTRGELRALRNPNDVDA